MTTTKKDCTVCNKEFQKEPTCSWKRWNAQRRFCSIKCKGIADRGNGRPIKGMAVNSCLVCNKQFKVYPYRKDTAKFCSRACIGRSRGGEKSPQWRGGITAINKAIRTSNQYKEWRTAVFERDNYTCQDCGERGGQLNADHIKLFSRHPELRFEVSNGQTLCRNCHIAKTRRDLKLNWSNQFARSN